MVAQSSGQWSDYGLTRGPFRLGRSDQRQFRAHLERTRCFERTLVWSEDTLVWEGLIRGNFRLARSDQGSLPDGTSTWVFFLCIHRLIYVISPHSPLILQTFQPSPLVLQNFALNGVDTSTREVFTCIQNDQRLIDWDKAFENLSAWLQKFKVQHFWKRKTNPGREKIRKIPGRGLAVNFRKKCGEMWWKKNNFHRVFLTYFCGECGESRWIIYFHRVLSILTKKNHHHTGSNLCPPACHPLLSPLRRLSRTSSKFHVNLNQIE